MDGEIEGYWNGVLETLRAGGYLLPRPQQGGYVVPEAAPLLLPDYCIFLLNMQRLGNVARERWLEPQLTERISQGLGGRAVAVAYAEGLALIVARSLELARIQQSRIPTHLPLTASMIPTEPYHICLGYGVRGRVTLDLADAERAILIGGTSGYGKTMLMQSMITQLAEKHAQDELRLVIVDPKFVDFGPYRALPQLLLPVANEIEDCARAVQQVAAEMERRKALLRAANVTTWQQYNEREETLPLIVLIVDEAADFAGTATMETLVDLARQGRAFGISLVIGTQHPTRDVIDSQIKANLLTAIAFKVKSNSDSRVILDNGGAELLSGKGRCLIFKGGEWQQIQTCYVDAHAREALLGAAVPGNAAALPEIESDLVRYAVENLSGAFTIGRLADVFQGRISKRQLTKLAQVWEQRGWLTQQVDAASPRRVTDELVRITGVSPV